MNHVDLEEFIRAMPKVELHVHLEGAMEPETVWGLAERNGIRLPAASPEAWRAQYGFRAFNHFIERSDGYLDSFPVGEYFDPERDADVLRAMRLARGRVLDIGCGAGRHALALQRRGLEVTGVDSSPLAIRVCRKRGVRDARVLGIDQVGRFPAGRFDTVIMFGNNFGLLRSPATARRLLRAIYRTTSPRALILAQTLDVHNTGNPVHLGYQRWNRRHGRLPGQVRIRVRFSNRVGPWFDYLMVSAAEMRSILRGTDWRLARCFGGPGALYVAVLKKK